MKHLLVSLFLATSFQANSSSCISHRGSTKIAQENSLQALMHAVRLNADGLEFDLRHTLDGVPILMHDKQLTTATHAEGMSCPLKSNISQLYYKQIKDNCVLSGKYPVRVPSLEEALHLLTGTRKILFVELKDEPTLVTEEILYYYFQDFPENLRIISLKPKYIKRLRTMNPANSAFWNEVGGGLNLIRRPAHRKIESNVWTVNKASRIRLFMKLGVDFITTDDIELCQTLKAEIFSAIVSPNK